MVAASIATGECVVHFAPFTFYGRWTSRKNPREKNPLENKPTRWRFLRVPDKDTDSTGSVTEVVRVPLVQQIYDSVHLES